jgi:hypothetical protein
LAVWSQLLLYLFFDPHRTLEYKKTDLPIFSPYVLRRALPIARSTYPPASPLLYLTIITSTGIITCCPSPTLFSLSLGPDLP